MSSVKLFPLAIVLFLVVIVYTGFNEVGQESLIKNDILDNNSRVLILNIQSDLNNNFNNLNVTESNLSNSTGNEGIDAFTRQFQENKQEKSKLEGLADNILSIPDLLILSFNQDLDQEDLNLWKGILIAFLVIVLLVAGLTAIFGSGRFSD